MAAKLPAPLLEKLSASLTPLNDYVEKRTKTFEIGTVLDSAYIDGSIAADERRGSIVVLFSVASLYLKGMPMRYEKGLPGREKTYPTVFVPKMYGEERASYLMRGLELLEAIRAIRLGTRLVVMDGSYVTLLLSAYGFPEEIASQAGNVSCEDPINRISVIIDHIREDPSPSSFHKAVSRLIGVYADALAASKNWDEALACTSQLALEIVLEAGVTLLEDARRKNADIIWVSKETDMGVLSEQLGVEKWMKDLVALDELWKHRERCYLSISPRKEIGPPRRTLASENVLSRLYRSPWNKYNITYAKLGGVTLQITYPILVNNIEEVLGTLASISGDSGYPKPLIHVHHMASIPRERARFYADTIWADSRGIERILLAPMGRILLGLPG